uniref:ankyrin repeat domain-containing protein n=1 Tax=Hylemonella sp. TaxID=2066020 RepID=UPI0035AE0110
MSAGDWKDLYAAASQGDLALVRYHLRAGVNPNYQHPEVLCTPLVASIIHGHDEVALCLLEQGADPRLRSDFDDMTPLEAARQHGRSAIEARLQALGVKPQRQPFWRRWLPV